MPAKAGDEPFITPANSGFTGIMELPTARTLKENSYRVGISQIDPYRYYYVALSPLEGIELSVLPQTRETQGLAAMVITRTNPSERGFGS
jgi:hypothetical protein